MQRAGLSRVSVLRRYERLGFTEKEDPRYAVRWVQQVWSYAMSGTGASGLRARYEISSTGVLYGRCCHDFLCCRE